MNLSWIAFVFGVVATFPQMYQTLSTGILRDHHPWTPVLALVGNFFLALHGYYRKDYGLMILGAWFMMYNAVLTQYIDRTAAS
jgi:hypothetical protein